MSRPDWLPSFAVSVNLHIYETTDYRVRVYPADDRVTADAEGSGGTVTLYLDGPEIARLRRVLEQAERDLIARQNTENGPRVVRGPAG